MESFLKKLSSIIFKYHKPIFLLSIFLGAFSIILIFRLELKTDMLEVLPSNDPNISRFKEFLDNIGSTDSLIVVVEPIQGNILGHIDVVEKMAGKFSESPMIEYVDYNFMKGDYDLIIKNFTLFLDDEGLETFRKRLSPLGLRGQLRKNKEALFSQFSSPVTMELIASDPLNIRSLIMSSLPRTGSFSQSGYYTNKDNSMLLLFVKPKRPVRDMEFIADFNREIMDIIDSINGEFGDVVKIGLTGPYAFGMEANASLNSEIKKSTALSTILIILLFQFIYRKRFLVLILVGVTLFISLACTLALAYTLFGGLNMVSSIVIVMLMGMSIDYIIHVYNRWEEEYHLNGNIRDALEISFTKVLPGVITGAVTTALAFLSIIFTNFKGIHELGIVAAIGIVLSLLVTIFFMSSAIVWFAPFLVSKQGSGKRMFMMADAIIRNRGLGLSLGIVLLIISIIFIPTLRFDLNPEAIGVKASAALSLQKKMAKAFKRDRNPLMVIIKEKSKGRLFEQYDNLEKVARGLEEDKVIGAYSSLSLFMPPPTAQKASIARLKEMKASIPDFKKSFLEGLKANGFVMNDYYVSYIEGINKALSIEKPLDLTNLEESYNKKIGMFYNQKKLSIATYLYPISGSEWADTSISKVSASVSVLGDGAYITGVPIIFKTLKGTIMRDSIIASIITFFLITFVCYLHFRDIKWVIIILASISISFIYTLGVMTILGLRFNFVNLGAIPLMFGIGVDYSVYIVQGYLRDDKDIKKSLARTGKSVLMCATTTAFGFGALMTMSFKGIASIGAVITIGVSMCLFSTIVILPQFISFFEGISKKS